MAFNPDEFKAEDTGFNPDEFRAGGAGFDPDDFAAEASPVGFNPDEFAEPIPAQAQPIGGGSETKFGDTALATIGGITDIAKGVPSYLGHGSSLSMRQSIAPQYKMQRLIIAEDRATGKRVEIPLEERDEKFSEKYQTLDIVDAPTMVKQDFLESAAKRPGVVAEKISAGVEKIKPQGIKDAQERVRMDAGNEALPFYKSSWYSLIDNSGNLIAGTVNPQLAYSNMWTSERQSMKDELLAVGIDEGIADNFATLYGSASAPIEYIENAGRLTGAFGKRAKKRVVSASTAPVRRAISQMMKNAGVNIGEEMSQQAIFNLLYNEAVKESNATAGTNIEQKQIFDISEMKSVAKGSLGMSVWLDAIGLPVRVHKHRSTSRNNYRNLVNAGISEDVANEYSKKLAVADSQEQLDLIKQEMFRNEEVKRVVDSKGVGRVQEIMEIPNPTPEETQELNALIDGMSTEGLAQVEEQRVRGDVQRLAQESPAIEIPAREDKTGKNKYSQTVMDTASELSRVYGREVTPEEVYDAFVPPMDMVEIVKEREAQEAQVKKEKTALEQLGKGWSDELFAQLPQELQEEIRERTTGEEREALSGVLKDIKTREVKDATDTEQRAAQAEAVEEDAGKPQEAKEGRAQEEAIEAAVGGKQPAPDAKPIPAEKVAPEAREAAATPQEKGVVSKIVLPPNPQIPVARWFREMQDFAIKMIQSGSTKNEFISEMEADYLHYDATAEDLAGIYEEAKIDAKRIAKEVARAEKASAKAKITQKQFKPKQKQSVDSAVLIKELMRIQERASKQGRRAGIQEVKQQIKDSKVDAKELVAQLKEQMEGLIGASKLEREKIRGAIKDIQLASDKTRPAAFDKAVDLVAETFENIEERTPRYEYKPFPEPENVFGVDANSSFQDLRKVYLENGGKRKDESLGRRATKKEMANFILGTPTQESTATISDVITGLEEQRDKAKKDGNLRRYNKVSNAIAGLKNFDDLLHNVSILDKSGYVRNISTRLAENRSEQGAVAADLRKIAEKNGISDDFKDITWGRGGKRRKYNLTLGGKTITLSGSEALSLHIQLQAADNRAHMDSQKGIMLPSGKFLRFGKAKDIEAALNKELEKHGVADTFSGLVEKWNKITDKTGDLIVERHDALQKKRGSDVRLEKTKGVYFPISTAKNSADFDEQLEELKVGGIDSSVNMNNAAYNMLGRGELNKRIGAGKDGYVKVNGAIETLDRIINDTAEFYASGETIMDITKLMNNKDFSDAIMDVYGKNYFDMMTSKLNQIQGRQKRSDASKVSRIITKPLRGLVRKATQLRLIALTTQMKMRGSMFLAMSELENPKASIVFAEAHLGNKFLKEKALQNGTIKTRWETEMFSPELMWGRTEKAIIKNLRGSKTKADKIRIISKSWGDKSAIMGIYRMVAFDEMVNQGLGRTISDMEKLPQSFFDEIGAKTAYIIGTTQPSGYAEHLSVLKSAGRENEIAMLTTLYGSQASRLFGNMDMAVAEYMNKKDDASLKNLGQKAFYFAFMNSLYMSLVMFGGRALKDISKALWSKPTGEGDDDDELIENLAGQAKRIPKDMLKNIGKMSEVSDNAMDMIEAFGTKYKDEMPLDDFAGRELQSSFDFIKIAATLSRDIKNFDNGVYTSTVDGKKVEKPIATLAKQNSERKRIQAKIKKMVDSGIYGTGFWANLPTRYLETFELGDLTGKLVSEKL